MFFSKVSGFSHGGWVGVWCFAVVLSDSPPKYAELIHKSHNALLDSEGWGAPVLFIINLGGVKSVFFKKGIRYSREAGHFNVKITRVVKS